MRKFFKMKTIICLVIVLFVSTLLVIKLHEFYLRNFEICLLIASERLNYEESKSSISGTLFTEPKYDSCPTHGMVTVESGGGLANQVWEYASVWAVAKILNIEPYVPDDMYEKLANVFKHLSVPSMTSISHCKEALDQLYKPRFFWDPPPQKNQSRNVLLRRFIALFREVVRFQKELRNEFEYRQEYVDSAEQQFQYIKSLFVNRTKAGIDLLFVGVHVRRTDYIRYLKLQNITAAGKEFYMRGMEWFRAKFPRNKFAFLVTSDDMDWCKMNLKSDQEDIFFVSRGGPKSPVYDLTLLSLCNHSIIDYGTYGLWGAVMTGGETIVYDTKRKLFTTTWASNLLPHWHLIN